MKLTESDHANICGMQTPDGETWVFCWTPGRWSECVRQMGRYAADPDAGFTWNDMARMLRSIQEVRQYKGVYDGRLR